MRRNYATNEKLWTAIQKIATELEASGNQDASQILTYGVSCLNGLTDGWAMVLDSLDKTLREHKKALSKGHLEELKKAHTDVRKIVYR